jgi:D-alanyl-D-alanine carboxypeptidase (penicillin-binding protein 5/6)
MKFKKLLSLLLTFAIVGIFIPSFKGISTYALSFTPNFEVNSDYAVLYNADIDSVVYQKNADVQTEPAQLAQIMTAILCIENNSDFETTPVTIPQSVFDYLEPFEDDDYYTSSNLEVDEELTMKDLLYSMMLTSSCEAATTIAYYIGEGDINAFVDMMNDKARSIGCVNTNFTNPTGMHENGQYTTAYDMFLITKYACSLSKFNDIVSVYEYTIPETNVHDEQTINHSNIMMDTSNNYYYEYAKGIKTGNSEQAGSCIITKATKNGNNYILVLLHAPLSDSDSYGNKVYYHLKDAIALFDWCLDNFEYKALLDSSEEIKEVKVSYSSSTDYVLLRPSEGYSTLWPNTMDTSSIERVFDVKENISAPITAGDVLGSVTLILNGEEIYTTDLVATKDLERSFVKFNMVAAQGFIYSSWFNRALLASIILTFVYIGVYVYRVQSMPKKKKHKGAINSADINTGSATAHSAPRVKRVRQVNDPPKTKGNDNNK